MSASPQLALRLPLRRVPLPERDEELANILCELPADPGQLRTERGRGSGGQPDKNSARSFPAKGAHPARAAAPGSRGGSPPARTLSRGTVIPSKAEAAFLPGPASGAAIGYLWLKWVRMTPGHPASAATASASAVVQCRFRSAWSARESSKVASWITTEHPRARRANARLGRQSPLYATPHLRRRQRAGACARPDWRRLLRAAALREGTQVPACRAHKSGAREPAAPIGVPQDERVGVRAVRHGHGLDGPQPQLPRRRRDRGAGAATPAAGLPPERPGDP